MTWEPQVGEEVEFEDGASFGSPRTFRGKVVLLDEGNPGLALVDLERDGDDWQVWAWVDDGLRTSYVIRPLKPLHRNEDDRWRHAAQSTWESIARAKGMI